MSFFEGSADLDVLAEDNVRTLRLPKGRLNPPLAVILIGIPASGKTFLVQNLARTFPLAILSEEDMLKFLAPKISFFRRAQDKVLILAIKTIEKLVQKGISCIFDYNIKKRSDRDIVRQTVETAGGKFVLIHINLPKEEAYEQLSKSNYQVSRGEKKGVIMNKDLFDYEVAGTNFPAIHERALVYNSKKPDSLNIIVEQISTFTNKSLA